MNNKIKLFRTREFERFHPKKKLALCAMFYNKKTFDVEGSFLRGTRKIEIGLLIYRIHDYEYHSSLLIERLFMF